MFIFTFISCLNDGLQTRKIKEEEVEVGSLLLSTVVYVTSSTPKERRYEIICFCTLNYLVACSKANII